MDDVDLAALREKVAESKRGSALNNNDSEPFSLTCVATPEAAPETTRHFLDVLPWDELAADAVQQLDATLAAVYQCVVENQEELAIFLESDPFEDEVPESLISYAATHHAKARDALQADVQACRRNFECMFKDMCQQLQEAYDVQATHVVQEVRHQRERTTASLKRSRAAVQKQVDHFTGLETCLRRHEMQQLQALHDEKMAEAEAARVAQEERHKEALIQQKCSIAGMERTNTLLQTMVDEAHAEVERLKHMLHNIEIRKTTTNVISEVYVDALRDSARKANEAADMMRGEADKVQRDADALAAANAHLQTTLGDRDAELTKVRALLVESSHEIITLQNINEVTSEDLRDARTKIQDLTVELSTIKVDVEAQAELVNAGDAYVVQLTARVAQLTEQLDDLLAEHDVARAGWAAERAELQLTLSALQAQLQVAGKDPAEVAIQEIYKPQAKPTLHVATVAAISRGVQRLKAPLKRPKGLESLVKVLQTEKIDLPQEKVERCILLESNLREAITCQLTYEFKRAFSAQLRKRLEHERYVLDQKIDVVISRYLADEHAAKRLLSKKAGSLMRRRSKKPLLETTVPVRRLKEFLNDGYAAMGVPEWNGEEVAHLKDEIDRTTAALAQARDESAQQLTTIQNQQRSLVEADLFQKERDLLIVGLTEKLQAVKAEFEAQKLQWAQRATEEAAAAPESKAPLDVRGQLPTVAQRATRPMSAVPTPTKAAASARRRPMTSRSHGLPKPEHARSVVKRDLFMPTVAPGPPPTPEVPQKPAGAFVASLWVGEAGMQQILDRRRKRK
ncbi:hypothetical protein ACHHYP_03139 [Achlya hypogyna]|uniref:Uncharacterized protein n=1 Tax=Achlya hypogyna TaxID=1202772 RepID=A0A1V9Z4G3_ACHHY|nr:hypothetical protein ACHHYP_03139 [Achlya hypogyna]